MIVRAVYTTNEPHSYKTKDFIAVSVDAGLRKFMLWCDENNVRPTSLDVYALRSGNSYANR